MNYSRISMLALVSGCLSITAFAGTTATGTIQETAFSGGLYDYSIDLSNTGTTPIETFWFSWVPGQDYMATMPSNFSEPSFFNAPAVTGGGSGDGYAIRWESSTGLGAGDSAIFTFWSASTPAEIAGDSVFHGGPPVATAFVYSGIFPSGSSDQIVVQSVPTPSTSIALGFGLVGLLVRRKNRKQA
jgi:hypothetical protein